MPRCRSEPAGALAGLRKPWAAVCAKGGEKSRRRAFGRLCCSERKKAARRDVEDSGPQVSGVRGSPEGNRDHVQTIRRPPRRVKRRHWLALFVLLRRAALSFFLKCKTRKLSKASVHCRENNRTTGLALLVALDGPMASLASPLTAFAVRQVLQTRGRAGGCP
jgi:hypothetical protein